MPLILTKYANHSYLNNKISTQNMSKLKCEVELFRRAELRRSIEGCGFPIVPSSDLFIGNLEVMKSESTPFRFQELRRQYGKTYAVMQGAFPTVVTSDVDVIQDVCLKKFRFFHSRMVTHFSERCFNDIFLSGNLLSCARHEHKIYPIK